MNTTVIAIRYEWKPQTYGIEVDAETAGKEFARIAKRDGDIDPVIVVKESKGKASPLHNCFEWDDKVAGDQYRVDQARYLIRHIVTVPVRADTEEEMQPVRAFVKVNGNEEDTAEEREALPRRYVPIQQVMGDEDLRRRYVKQAYRDLVSWRKRYADIKEFSTLFIEIDKLGEKIK